MTYPYVDDPVPFLGQAPDGDAPWNDWSDFEFWIGDPEGPDGMFQLPPVAVDGYQRPKNKGRVAHTLAYGAQSVTEFPAMNGAGKGTETFTFTWDRLAPRDRALVDSLDDGDFGWPLCFLPPDDTNRLTAAQSMCTGAGWSPTSGTVAPYSAVRAPVRPSRVMQWSGQNAGARLVAGDVVAGSGRPTAGLAAPNVPALPFAFCCYVRAVAGTTAAHMRATGMNADGTGAVQVNEASTTVGTNWRRLWVLADPGAYGVLPWIVPSIVSEDGAALLIACAQASYTDDLPDWLKGKGVPRVVPTVELQPTVDANLNHALSMTLGEARTGRL